LGFPYDALFERVCVGREERLRRLFVGNLTMHSDASNEPEGEALVFSEEDPVGVPAVRTGAWIADVTYDEPSSAPPFGQPVTFTATVGNLAGVDTRAQDLPPACPEPVTHTGWGPWEVITGTGYGNPTSFQINSAGADDMGRSFDLVFPTQTAFPQREGNAVARVWKSHTRVS
jgi:hypothetical protein